MFCIKKERNLFVVMVMVIILIKTKGTKMYNIIYNGELIILNVFWKYVKITFQNVLKYE